MAVGFGSAGSIFVNIGAKLDGLTTGLRDAGTKLDKFAAKAGQFGTKLTMAVTAPLAGIGAMSVKLASDMEETVNKMEMTFAENADAIKAWSKTSLKSMGLAQQSALDTAALFGDIGKGIGFGNAEATEMSKTLTQLSADIASFKNVSQKQAETALTGIFTGESESLKRLGIVITESNLKAFADTKGMDINLSEMNALEKAQLRYQLVLEATKAAQGDFSRTLGGYSNQMRVFKEGLKEVGVQMGQFILPAATKLIIKINGIVAAFTSLDKKTKKLIVTIAKIAAAVGPVLLLGKAFLAVKGAIVAVRGALLLLNTNPVVIGITAISAAVAFLGAALVNHFGKGETFMKRLADVGKQVKAKVIEVASSVVNVLGPSFIVLRNFVQHAWATLGELFDEFKRSEFAYESMQSIATAVDWVKDRVGDLNKILGKAFDKLVELGGGGETMAEKISSAVKSILHIFSQGFLVALPQLFSKLFINVKYTIQQIGASFQILGENIVTIFKNSFGNVKAYFEALWEKIKDPTKEFKVDLVSITKGTSFDASAPVSSGQKKLVDSLTKKAEELKSVESDFDAYGVAVYEQVESMFKPAEKAAEKAAENVVKPIQKAFKNAEEITAPVSSTAQNFDAIRAELGLGAPGAGMTAAAVAPSDTLSSKGHNLPWFNQMMGWSQPVAPATTSAAQTLDTLAQTAGGAGTGAEPTATIRDGTGRAVQALKDIGSIILEMAGEFEIVKSQIATARA